MGFFSQMRDLFFAETDEADDVFYEESEPEKEEAATVDKMPQEPAAPSGRRSNSKVVNMSSATSTPNLTGLAGGGSMKMIVFMPVNFEDSKAIVDNLRARKPVIINMVDLDKSVAQRILDFISGAVYALNGDICRVSYGIFVVVPSNVSIVGNGENEEKQLFRD